jgi:hypothetical protein
MPGENDKLDRTPDSQQNSDDVSDVTSANASGLTPEGEIPSAENDKNAQGAAHQIIDEIRSGPAKEIGEGDSVVVEEVSEVNIGNDMMSKYFSLYLEPTPQVSWFLLVLFPLAATSHFRKAFF